MPIRASRSALRTVVLWMTSLLAVSAASCSYGDMVVHPNGKIYIQRHDYFLFGALRKLYECTPDGNGNITCINMSGRP